MLPFPSVFLHHALQPAKWSDSLFSLSIGHFRVPKTLTFKMRRGAQPFLWKWVFICMRMKNDFHIKGSAPTLVLKQRPGGTQKWPIAAKFGLKVDLWIISCKFLKFVVRVLSFIVSSLGVLLSSVAKSIYNKVQIERELSYFEKVWISLEYKINMELIKAVKPSANSFVWKFNKK